ncbi:MAG: FAD-dependent oxidoreductase [Rhodospirillales bacterium]
MTKASHGRFDAFGGDNGETFDLAVIGAGSAGFSAAIRAAELGARIVLIGGGRRSAELASTSAACRRRCSSGQRRPCIRRGRRRDSPASAAGPTSRTGAP